MPTTAQILELEDVNVCQITLYSEGMFWKAYQRSAFLLTQEKEKLKPTKKFVKAVGREVVSVGFPKKSLDQYFASERIAEQTEKTVTINATQIDDQAYQAWFNAVELKLAPEPKTTEPKATAEGESSEPKALVQKAESAPEPTAPEPKAEPKVAGSYEGDILHKVHIANSDDEILQKVRDFRIDSSSPLECMMFIGTIQKQLDGHL